MVFIRGCLRITRDFHTLQTHFSICTMHIQLISVVGNPQLVSRFVLKYQRISTEKWFIGFSYKIFLCNFKYWSWDETKENMTLYETPNELKTVRAHRVFKILCHIYHWCVAFKDAEANLVGVWTEFGVEKLNASVTERAKECKYPANIYDMYWLNYQTHTTICYHFPTAYIVVILAMNLMPCKCIRCHSEALRLSIKLKATIKRLLHTHTHISDEFEC